jgi:hypothetical protein
MTEQALRSAQLGCLQKAIGTSACSRQEFPRLIDVSSSRLRCPRIAWAWAVSTSEWMPSARRCGSRVSLTTAHRSGLGGMKTDRHVLFRSGDAGKIASPSAT